MGSTRPAARGQAHAGEEKERNSAPGRRFAGAREAEMEEGNNKETREPDQENDGDETSAERHNLRAQYQKEKGRRRRSVDVFLIGRSSH